MQQIKTTKTFDVKTPSGLLLKFRYDIERLREARFTTDVQYAALDCAVDGWHLVDWVLQTVEEDMHLELSGVIRKAKGISYGATAGFVKNNSQIPYLAVCQQIANTGKHLVIQHDDPSIETSTSVQFTPPFDATRPHAKTEARPVAKIEIDTKKINALDFFIEVESGWRKFLIELGLLSPQTASQEIGARRK